MDMEKCIEIQNLQKSFGAIHAVNNLSLQVETGQLFAFLGVNGAGKSTTISMICGQLRQDAGQIYVNGRNTLKNMNAIKQDIGVVFQNSVLDRQLSVQDNLKNRAALYGITGKAFQKRLFELDDLLELRPLLKQSVGKLSGGQRRRIDIARAIFHRPQLLILDEPANFVDNKFEKELYRTLHELNTRMAIVMVSHDIGTITSVVKEIVCVNRRVHRHRSNVLTEEQLRNYDCPIQLVSHGHIPHTVLEHHPGDGCCDHDSVR